MDIAEEVRSTLHELEEKYYRVISVLFILLLIIFVFWVSISAKAPLHLVAATFVPTFVLILCILSLLDTKFYHLYYNWIIAIVVLVGYFVLGELGILGFDIDFGLVFTVNALLSAVYLVFLSLGKKVHKQEEALPQSDMISVAPSAPEGSIVNVVHSLNDRCKAINFVIGRVYSKAHGGSDEIRKAIRIESTLYNAFNELKDQNIEEVKDHLVKILDVIQTRLALYDLPEVTMFKNHTTLKGLQRNEDGSDKVIDVLANNDKDPVRDYVHAALSFCEQALKELGEDA